MKSVVNPGNPTPSGYGFQLPNPEKFGKLVYYDDCEQATGTMIEAKGPEYASLLTFQKGRDSVTDQFLDQSGRQVAARGGRQLRWYFAEPEAAAFAEDLFRTIDDGRQAIEIKVLPWPEKGQ